MRASVLGLILMAAVGALQAGELYRWVDRDGRVHYTDTPPPPQARNAQRKQLGDRPGDAPLPFPLQQAMKNFPVTLYVAEGCGEGCNSAVAYLNGRGVPFTQKDARQEANANALMALTGGKLEVPVATVGSTVLRGYEQNAWKTALDAAGYPSSAVRPARAAAAAKPAPTVPQPQAAPEPASD